MNLLAAAAALGVLAGLAASAPSGAQDAAAACGADQERRVPPAADCGAGSRPESRLTQIDDESNAAQQLFEQIDRNGDGQITPEEWSDWYDTEFAAATASAQGSSPATN